jgi:non-ribosomal peptide synthetase component F
MLRHESIVNYLYAHPANTHIHAIAETVHALLCVTTMSFDMSMKEYGAALCNGKTVVFASEEETTNAAMLADLFRRTGADAINATNTNITYFLIVYSILIFIFALVNNIKDVEQGRPFIRHKTV